MTQHMFKFTNIYSYPRGIITLNGTDKGFYTFVVMTMAPGIDGNNASIDSPNATINVRSAANIQLHVGSVAARHGFNLITLSFKEV